MTNRERAKKMTREEIREHNRKYYLRHREEIDARPEKYRWKYNSSRMNKKGIPEAQSYIYSY